MGMVDTLLHSLRLTHIAVMTTIGGTIETEIVITIGETVIATIGIIGPAVAVEVLPEGVGVINLPYLKALLSHPKT